MKSLLEQFKDLIANTSKAEMDAIWDDIMLDSKRVGPTIDEFLEYTKPIKADNIEKKMKLTEEVKEKIEELPDKSTSDKPHDTSVNRYQFRDITKEEQERERISAYENMI